MKGRKKSKGGNWISGAIRHPGAATAAAKREGVSVGTWAREHRDSPGTTGKRARLALTLRKLHGGKKRD